MDLRKLAQREARQAANERLRQYYASLVTLTPNAEEWLVRAQQAATARTVGSHEQ
jgi:hypothetical protein